MRLAIDIAGFQATWWAAALGAGAGRWEPGLIVGAVVVLLQLAMARGRSAALTTVATAGALAIVLETMMIVSGLVTYAAVWPAAMFAPVWLVALWMVFATCMEATLRMLGERPLAKGAVLGAALAPPTYWAGQGLGALKLADPVWLPLAATAAVWAAATPVLLVTFAMHSRDAGLSTRSPS